MGTFSASATSATASERASKWASDDGWLAGRPRICICWSCCSGSAAWFDTTTLYALCERCCELQLQDAVPLLVVLYFRLVHYTDWTDASHVADASTFTANSCASCWLPDRPNRRRRTEDSPRTARSVAWETRHTANVIPQWKTGANVWFSFGTSNNVIVLFRPERDVAIMHDIRADDGFGIDLWTVCHRLRPASPASFNFKYQNVRN